TGRMLVRPAATSALDLEALRLLALLERQDDLQHAVLHAGFGLAAVGAFGKRDAAVEASVATLGTVETLLRAALLALFGALALDRQCTVLDVDLDVVLG